MLIFKHIPRFDNDFVHSLLVNEKIKKSFEYWLTIL